MNSSRPRHLLGQAGLVAIGGAVGVTLRAILEHLFPAATGSWPWTTFGINLVGSLLLGLLLEVLSDAGPDSGRLHTIRLTCGTGVLGGFTTYSSFAVEIVRLGRHGQLGTGIAYAGVSVAIGVLSALAGIAFASAIRRRPGGGT